MNVGAEKVVLKSGAEDLTGMHNLKKGMIGTTGDTNKGDEEFIKRNYPNMFVVKFIFNQKKISDYALVDGKYVRVVVEEGKNLAAKKKRRPKRSKRRSKKRSKKAKKGGANTPPPPPPNISTQPPRRGMRPLTSGERRYMGRRSRTPPPVNPRAIVRRNATRGILSRDNKRQIAGAKNRRSKRRTKRR